MPKSTQNDRLVLQVLDRSLSHFGMFLFADFGTHLGARSMWSYLKGLRDFEFRLRPYL